MLRDQDHALERARRTRALEEAQEHQRALLDDVAEVARGTDDPEQLQRYLGELAADGELAAGDLEAVQELLSVRAPGIFDAVLDDRPDAGASLAAEIVSDVAREHGGEPSVIGLDPDEAAWARREVRRAARALALEPGELTVRADGEAARRVAEEDAAGLAEGHVIYLDRARLRPHHRAGRALLGHELAHAGQARAELHPHEPSDAVLSAAEREARSFARAFETGSVLWRPTVALPATARAADHGRRSKKRNRLGGGGLRHAALRHLRRTLPYLAAALTKTQLDQVGRFLETCRHLRQLTNDYDAVPKTIASEHQARREALTIQMDATRDLQEQADTLTVPVPRLVGPDVHGGTDLPPHAATMMDQVYQELLEWPFVVTLRDDEKIATISWGRMELSHHKGRIERSDLERNSYFGKKIAKAKLEDYAEEEEQERAAGGYFWSAEMQKLGELYAHSFSDTELRIGKQIGPDHGLPDDARGLSDANVLCAGTSVATAVLRSPDGWLHVFTVEPTFSTERLKAPKDDGWGWVLDTESEVASQVVLLKASDGITLTRHVEGELHGWRARVAYEESRLQEFATGAIMGDWYEDPSAFALMGQVFGGFVPGLQQVGVARDIFAAMHKVWTSGRKDGKLQLIMALSALLPINKIIEGLKRRGGQKAVNGFLKEEAPALRRRLERELARDPTAFAQRFHLDRAMREAAEGLFESADDDFVRTLGRMFDEAGGMVGGGPARVINASGGSWKKLTARLHAVGEGGGQGAATAKELGDALESWRHQLVTETLPAKVEQAAAAAGVEGGVKLERTGSKKLISDCDVSFKGPNAVSHRNLAERYLKQTLGSDWENAIDGSMLIDPKRLHLHLDLADGLKAGQAAKAGRFASKVERNLTKEAELNVLVRMIREGREESAQQLAKKLKISWKKVQRRGREIEKLAADGGAKVKQLELEVEVLHRKFASLPPSDIAKRSALAQEIAVRQGKINVLNPEAYVTSGGVFTEVTRRAFQGKAGMTRRRAYMTALDNVAMLGHVQAELAHNGLTPSVAKGLSKYGKRLLSVAYIYNVPVKKMPGVLELTKAHSHNLVKAQRQGAATLVQDGGAGVLALAEQLAALSDEILKKAKTRGGKALKTPDGQRLINALTVQRGVFQGILATLRRPLVTAPKEGAPKAGAGKAGAGKAGKKKGATP